MYVRDAKDRDEAWLLEQFDALGVDAEVVRPRDYALAVDEDTNTRVGFGRLRVYSGEPDVCELTGIGTLPSWRGQGVGAHVIERLVAKAGDVDCETVYVLTDQHTYLTQFGFQPVEPTDLPDQLSAQLDHNRQPVDEPIESLALGVEAFEMPDRLREAFKTAAVDDESTEPQETAEDFGINPETATYKYDTG